MYVFIKLLFTLLNKNMYLCNVIIYLKNKNFVERLVFASNNVIIFIFRKFLFGKKKEVKFSTFAEGMAHGGMGASGKVSGR